MKMQSECIPLEWFTRKLLTIPECRHSAVCIANKERKPELMLPAARSQERQHFSRKPVRSGRATEVAASRCTLSQVFEAGEWRSAAFLRYLDETSADNLQLLRAAHNESDAE